MNYFFPLSHNQKFSNTTSLSNGILKKLAITLAVSAIGVSTLVPIAHAGSEVVAEPGDIITVTEDIYGISGNFADGGTLTVKNGGQSFAEKLREEAGSDDIIGTEDFFKFVEVGTNSEDAQKFTAFMGDKIDANGNMQVDDILKVVPVFDAHDDLPLADGLNKDDVTMLFTDAFSNRSSEDINHYVNSLNFDESSQGEDVYDGYETNSLPLFRALAENSSDDYRYSLKAIATIADSEGNVSSENFKNILPAELFLKVDGEEISDGDKLLAQFNEKATNGKLPLGDAWVFTNGEGDIDGDDLDEYTAFINHAGKDLILTKAELDAAGVDLGAETDKVNNFWNGLQSHVNDDGKVDITTAIAFLDVSGSANDFLQEDESEYTAWNDNGRVTTQNVAHVVNEAFTQAQYNNPILNQESVIVRPYVDPQKVLTQLGSADDNGTYDADDVYDAILDVYMAEWQVEFDKNDHPNLNQIFENTGSNGRISIDDYITASGISGTKEEAVRALLKTASDENGTVSPFDAYFVDNFDDLVEEIYKNTDDESPVSIDDIIDAVPDGVSSESKDAFAGQLEGLTADDGTIARETALDKLTEFVLENPGNELEQPEGDGNVLGYMDEDGNNSENQGIYLKGENDLILNNEVDVYGANQGIVVSTQDSEITPSTRLLGFNGDVSVVNSGDIVTNGKKITLYGNNVTLNNSGELRSNNNSPVGYHGIIATAADTINITNTGDITFAEVTKTIYAHSYNGDVTIENDGDLTPQGIQSVGISAYSGVNTTYTALDSSSDSHEASTGGDVKVTNSGDIKTDNIDSHAIATWSNGGNVDVINTGKLSTLYTNSAGIEIYSGTNQTEFDHVIQKGGDVSFTNSGIIRTAGQNSYGIDASSYGGAADGINSGDISTKGQNSVAISVSSGINRTTNERVPLKGGDVTLNNTGALSTQGANALAIDIWSNGGKVDLINEGTLTTLNDNSAGIDAYSGTNRTTDDRVVREGDAVSVENSGDISTQGNFSAGIDAGSHGGTAEVDNSGDVSTKGSNSDALSLTSGTTGRYGGRVPLEGSDVIAKNTGDLSTQGGYSSGLYALSNGGKVTASNEGKITTGGEQSHGITLGSGFDSRDNKDDEQAGGEITLTNKGAIETSGNRAANIKTWNNGGTTSVTNEAKLTATGESSSGIKAFSGHEEDGTIITAGGDITINNTGEIVGTGVGSVGIESGSDGADVKIENSGDVTASSAGIGIETAKNGEITNSGDITAKGENSGGLLILAEDTALLTNTGNVQVEGQLGLAALALNSASVDNLGDVSLVRNWSDPKSNWNPAIGAISLNDASIKNSGKVTAEGDNMIGLYAENKRDDFENPEDAEEGTQLASIINSGKVTTDGDGSTAISATSGANRPAEGEDAIIGSDVSVENSGVLSTMGKEAIALQAWSNGGSVDVTNEGAITTLKADSEGIDASSGTRKEINGTKTQAGESVKVTNSSNISTKGEDSEGIYANSYGGTVEVDNSGDISTTGLESSAISLGSGNSRTSDGHVPLAGSDVTLKNSGVISTTGQEAEGLHAWSNGGNVTASNTGKITTSGEEANGIGLFSGDNGEISQSGEHEAHAGGNITLTNEGAVETTGENVANIKTWNNGGVTSITNDAKLTATGKETDGIKAFSGHEEDGKIITAGGDITINNTGEIAASGDYSDGIEAGSHGGDVKIENSGDVSATESGIVLDHANKGELTNSGKITVNGIEGAGMSVVADDTATLTNTGNVEVEGLFGMAAVALNSALVENSGNVNLMGDLSNSDSSYESTISAYSANDASLKNSGQVTTTGDNISGLYAGSSEIFENGSDTTKKANIENSGDVTTKGNGKAHAAYIKMDGTGTLTNSGSLTTEGKTNTVVVDGKGGFTLDNAADGVIEAKDGLAIVTEETKDTITNLGTIRGGANLAAGDDLLDNKGILEGNFDFGDGEDTLNLSDLSKVSAATFDGGASDDVVNLSGGGEIATNQIVNFETANLLSGDFSGNVMDKFTKLVNVESGASLSGFNKINNLTSSGTVSVAAGETLDVTGDLNIEGGQFNLGVDSTSKHAVVNVSGDASFASTSNLFINVAEDGSLTLDESVTVLNGNTLTFDEKIASTAKEAEEEFDVEDDYISYDFSGRVEKAEKGDLLVLTVRDSIGSVVEEVGEEYGGAIKHIASLSDDKVSEENSVLTELKSRLDKGQVEEAQELMEEVVSSPGASQIASTQNTSSFTAGNMVINRAAARIDGGYTATLSADDSSNILGYNPEYKAAPHIRNIMAMNDEGTEASLATAGYNGEIWMQVYGVYQENGGKVKGETNVFGGAAGIDFLVNPETVIGLGFVYSSSDSDADTTNAHTDIETDSYGITAYGMTQFNDGYRLGGSLAYYWNNHDLKRQILANRMKADYDSTTFVARAELGKEFDMGDYTFMPQIGAIYTTNSADSYKESGPLAQAVSSTDTDSFIGSIGFVMDSQQEWNGMLVRPELHMNILHEFNDELGSFSGALVADNSVNVNSTITTLQSTRYNIGGGLKLNHTTAFASELAYDGIFAENTQEHLFRYKASYKY